MLPCARAPSPPHPLTSLSRARRDGSALDSFSKEAVASIAHTCAPHAPQHSLGPAHPLLRRWRRKLCTAGKLLVLLPDGFQVAVVALRPLLGRRCPARLPISEPLAQEFEGAASILLSPIYRRHANKDARHRRLAESRRTLQCAVRLLGQLHRLILRTGEARQAMRGMHCHRQWTGCAADTAVCSGTHLRPRVALRADLRRARVGQHEPSGAQACHATSSVHREMQRNLRACEVSRRSCISPGLGIVMSKRAGPAHGVQPPSATHRPATPSRDKPRRDTTRRAWFDRTARVA